MKFDINLSLNKDFEKKPTEYTGTKIAKGYVEVNDAFKFPVQVLKKKSEAQMFVKYPDIPDENDNYRNIVFPVDEELRNTLNLAIINEVKSMLMKGLSNPEIDSVRVNVLQTDIRSGNVATKGYASVLISGFVINGISIKETGKGLFVQMPQMRDASGQYSDIVYGTNALMQKQIKEAVLEKYREEAAQIQKEREKELELKVQENNPVLESEKTLKA